MQIPCARIQMPISKSEAKLQNWRARFFCSVAMISLIRLRIVFTLLITAISLVCAASGQTNHNPQKFTGLELPLPPQQKIAWNPPAEAQQLPGNFVTSTISLFAHGLADPRGCEYREIKMTVGNVWGGAGVITTHGWVFPAGVAGQHFAVGWNGLVYPLLSVGNVADLHQDILAAIAADDERRAKWAKERPGFAFYRFRNAWPEDYSLAHLSLLPLKASLLLRLGEVELARKVWTTWIAGMQAGTNDDSLHLRDPYLMLVTDWAWALFDRAVTAHMRGDDQLALFSARALAPVQKVVEDEVERRGLQRDYYGQAESKRFPRYLPFLTFLPPLLGDQERRANERQLKGDVPRKLAIVVGLNKLPTSTARIMALIRDLDEVRAFQPGQPGGINLAEDPTVKALVDEGEPAVEPLLAVLESDQRLTRSVHFWRSFSTHRSILGAHEAAYVAITRILKTSFFGVASTGDDLTARGIDGRRAVVAQIRRYWKEYGRTPIEERWYRILLNDHESLNQWSQAASRIVELADVGELPGNLEVTHRVTFSYLPNQVFTFRGEALRQKTQPTVSYLLIRRMKEVIERKDEQWLTPLCAATDFAVALATWDGANHLDELRQITKQLENMFATGPNLDRREHLIGFIVRLYVNRHEIGDREALSAYAEWLRTVKPEDAGDYATPSLFELAIGQTSAPAITQAITAMFTDPASPWFPLIKRDNRQSFHAAKLMETPLLNVSGFRDQLLAGLSDKSVVGTLRPRPAHPVDELDLTPENTYGLLLARGSNIGSTVIKISADDRNVARPLHETRFRVCDVIAWELSGIEGAPVFEVYWTESARDAAVEACLKFLRQHDGDFVYSPERFYKMHYAAR